MKSQNVLTVVLLVVAVGALLVVVSDAQGARGFIPPTPAPTATPRASDSTEVQSPESTSIPLVRPLETKEQALDMAFFYDEVWAVWEKPWTTSSLTLEPMRFLIEKFASRTAESVAHGLDAQFAPELDKDAGEVWSITIKGNVHVMLSLSDPNIHNRVYDSVTYVISQRTGQLLAIRTGQPKLNDK